MKYVRDDEIKTAFITMLNKLIYDYRLVLIPYLKVLENSSGNQAIRRIQYLELLISQNSEQREALTKLMAQGYIDQILYNQETNALLLQAETYRSDIEAITNGIAVIDHPAADKLKQLYKNYLSGMSLSKAASAAGIKTYHGTAKRLMETAHYLGDSFYPAIIDKDTYQKAQEERKLRATALGRNNKQTQMRKLQIPIHFHMGEVTVLYDNPVKQAEYLYNLIESESK